jgi:hypothetical protein
MHDEDCAIGFNVANPGGESWYCYGDKRALDQEDAENLERCIQAIQASADEVYKAFTSKIAPLPVNYAAWTIAPTLESARVTTQALATLFTFTGGRRQNITNRRDWTFTTNWWFWSTAFDCKKSGRWDYPITLDGIQHTSSRWTSICAISPQITPLHVIYQSSSGSLISSQHVDDLWTHSLDKPITDAVQFTPLTSVDWDNGRQASEFKFVLAIESHIYPQ